MHTAVDSDRTYFDFCVAPACRRGSGRGGEVEEGIQLADSRDAMLLMGLVLVGEHAPRKALVFGGNGVVLLVGGLVGASCSETLACCFIAAKTERNEVDVPLPWHSTCFYLELIDIRP